MDRDAAVRSRDALVAGWILLVFGAFLGVVGGAAAWKYELEPLSSAEERCPPPANGVDSPAWQACLERESARSGLEAALPTLGVAFGALLAGPVIIARARGATPVNRNPPPG